MSTVTGFSIQNFQEQLKGGALANQFYADLTLPSAIRSLIDNSENADTKFRFSFKATQLPASTVGEIIVPFRGAQFKIPGDRVFADWTITVLNDTDQITRSAFEEWSDSMVGNVVHDAVAGDTNPLDYMGQGEVHQLTRNGTILKSYNIIGCWPKEIGEIEVSFDNTDQIEEFTVTMSFQWWESDTTRNNTTDTQAGISGGTAIG